jgi:hypothetical protein
MVVSSRLRKLRTRSVAPYRQVGPANSHGRDAALPFPSGRAGSEGAT